MNKILGITFVCVDVTSGEHELPAKLNLDSGCIFDIEGRDEVVRDHEISESFILVPTFDEYEDVKELTFAIERLGDGEYAVEDIREIRDAVGYAPEDADEDVDITLNTFDAQGNVVDTTTMPLSVDALSDIVDHAAQLVIVERDGGDASQVMAELEEALISRGVVPDSEEPEFKEVIIDNAAVTSDDIARLRRIARLSDEMACEWGEMGVGIKSLIQDRFSSESVLAISRNCSEEALEDIGAAFRNATPDAPGCR